MGSTPPRTALAICYGTRPQVIKASILADVLGSCWDLLTIDTGQHYDYELNALLYEQLGVRQPHLCLEVGSGDHASQTSAILVRAHQALAARKPWAVVVIGDTNSTLGCALAAAKMRIPVIHVEAGLRAADPMLAEEINRRVVDHISAVLCAPSALAENQLHREDVDGSVRLTGDVARDVLQRHLPGARPADILPWWPLDRGTPFVFATLHRAELVENVARLRAVLTAFGRLEHAVIFAVHPRTRAMLGRHELSGVLSNSVHVFPPVGYLEALACVRDAKAVITDSGGVQREAYWLGTPCITVRAETEWEETLELGANVLVLPEEAPLKLPPTVDSCISRGEGKGGWDRNAYGDGNAAVKIRDAIEPLASAHRAPSTTPDDEHP